MKTPLTELSGVGPSMAERLVNNGYACVEDIACSDLKNLCSVPGIGPVSGERLLAVAIAMVVVEEELPAKSKKTKKKSKKDKKSKSEKKKSGKNGKKSGKSKKSKKGKSDKKRKSGKKGKD